MNIFFLDKDPRIAARQHCNKHVVKMILESAQMMSTIHRLHGNENPVLYSKTHEKHPSVLWAMQSKENYMYLFRLYEYLLTEYTYRYGKEHKSGNYELRSVLLHPPSSLPTKGCVQFPDKHLQAMPEQYKNSCAIQAYRDYYKNEKKGFAEWFIRRDKFKTEVQAPEWYIAA